jgi:hypothetical protein
MGKCHVCGADNDGAARFCGACGTSIQPTPATIPADATAGVSAAATEQVPAVQLAANGNGASRNFGDTPATSAPRSSNPWSTQPPLFTDAPATASIPAVDTAVAVPEPVAPQSGEARRRVRTWIPVCVTAACGVIAVVVFALLWTSARSDAHTTKTKLTSTRHSLAVTAQNLAISRKAADAANATVARERASLATTNQQLTDAQQSESGLRNSIDSYKTCGADLGRFFQAVENNNNAGSEAALLIAKADCDRIDPTIIPLQP